QRARLRLRVVEARHAHFVTGTGCAKRRRRAARTSEGRAAQRTRAANASRPLGEAVPAVPVHAAARPEARGTVDEGDPIRLPALARPLHRLLRLGCRLDRHDPLQVAPQRSWRLKADCTEYAFSWHGANAVSPCLDDASPDAPVNNPRREIPRAG